MNGVFKKCLDKFIILFLNDILIYSKSKEEHEKHFRMVLKVLRENKLYANLCKFIFNQKKIHYMGNITLIEGMVFDPKNIDATRGWIPPRNVTEVISFMGVYGSYQDS